MKQPDTTTMEGRHAVERASETCRIQFKARVWAETENSWQDRTSQDAHFYWPDFDFRIHPDDLAKLPEPEWAIHHTSDLSGDWVRSCELHRNVKRFGRLSDIYVADLAIILTALNRPDQSERVKELDEQVAAWKEAAESEREKVKGLEAEVVSLRVELNNWKFRHVSEPDQPADEWRPWISESEVPIGQRVRHKDNPKHTPLIIDAYIGQCGFLYITVGTSVYHSRKLFNECLQLDGTPCGTPCGARKEEV